MDSNTTVHIMRANGTNLKHRQCQYLTWDTSYLIPPCFGQNFIATSKPSYRAAAGQAASSQAPSVQGLRGRGPKDRQAGISAGPKAGYNARGHRLIDTTKTSLLFNHFGAAEGRRSFGGRSSVFQTVVQCSQSHRTLIYKSIATN